MEIKILCECGAKFKFDVEPIDGRSPGPVQCPSCGKDQTASTDLKIGEQLAASAPAAAPAGTSKRISILAVMPGAAPAPAPVSTPAAAPAPAAAAPVVKVSAQAAIQVSPKMAVMEVPATVKALSVKAPGEHVEEAPAAPPAPAPGSEPKAAGSPKMAYMPVPEATKALSVKPPGEHAEEHAPAQIASNSPAPGSPKMAKMEVPTGGTSLSVAGHAKKEEAPASEPIRVGGDAVSAPAAAPAHPATARMATPPREIPKSSGVGMGIFGAIVGALIGGIAWYVIAMKAFSMTLMMLIPGAATGFMARLFARRANQTVAIGAGVCAAIAIALTQMAIISSFNEKNAAFLLEILYQERMELAKQAADAKTDEQVRDVMIDDPDTAAESRDQITDEAIAKYRRNELAALVKFSKGDPSRARFEETERQKLAAADELPKTKIRWIGILIWAPAALSAAFKLAGGVSKNN